MKNNRVPGPEITPKIKVGELIEAYPQLLDLLTSYSPAFAKLRNPILFRTVARVSTLQQVAVVGGLKLDDLLNRLREAVGQDYYSATGEEDYPSPPEEWPPMGSRIVDFNATELINKGDSPLGDILRMASDLGTDEILRIETPFVPAPVIAMLEENGFHIYLSRGTVFHTWVFR